jgi:hypothetical protein
MKTVPKYENMKMKIVLSVEENSRKQATLKYQPSQNIVKHAVIKYQPPVEKKKNIEIAEYVTQGSRYCARAENKTKQNIENECRNIENTAPKILLKYAVRHTEILSASTG